ncbi:MAG: GNAT family N-acetyltransferase [Actinomycetes bacterium]
MTERPGPDIRRVRAEEIWLLRHSVLRSPDLPLSESQYPQDDLEETVHLAVFADGAPVACATFFPEELNGEPALRLRGMATERAHQGLGYGGALLEFGLRLAETSGAPLVWCNARTNALAFYRRHGFQTVGEEFVSAGGVPHYRAWVALPRNPTST